jgi:catechol 2,3-dioxygenase
LPFFAVTQIITPSLLLALDRDSKHAELHHIAFEMATLAEVFQVRETLREHNVTITFDGRRRTGCQIAVEFLDPDKHTIEIYWGLDQVGTNGYVRPTSEWKGSKPLKRRSPIR